MTKKREYWFPAKRYGWGWGPPSTWQGWVVVGVFIVLLGAGLALFPVAKNTVGFLLYSGVLVLLLIAVCYAKGEPPSWRWGNK